MLFSSALTCVILAGVVLGDRDGDCMYNTCQWIKNPSNYNSRHEPCMGTGGRGLVRDVACANGDTVHICCRLPYRQDVQTPRQKLFRDVTWTLEALQMSPTCVSRILCEMACQDGLKGKVRSHYPEVLPNDSSNNAAYVAAYTDGEGTSCFQEPSKQAKSEETMDCSSHCYTKYPGCDKAQSASFTERAIYTSAFHGLGMWSFSTGKIASSTFMAAERAGVTVLKGVQRGYINLHDRMVRLQDAYANFTKSPQQTRERRDTDGNPTSTWTSFLKVYNGSDPVLVDIVYETMDDVKFEGYEKVINDTLLTHDFGPGPEWFGNSVGKVVGQGFHILASSLLFLVIYTWYSIYA